MDAIILTALLRTILTVTIVWNTVETGDINNTQRAVRNHSNDFFIDPLDFIFCYI